MSKCKPIPPAAISVKVDRWGCGPECCDMGYFRIVAVMPALAGGWNWLDELWVGSSFCHDEGPDEDDRQALKDACAHYGIPIDPEPEGYWDWDDAERKLA